jgi:hypothetical protein
MAEGKTNIFYTFFLFFFNKLIKLDKLEDLWVNR